MKFPFPCVGIAALLACAPAIAARNAAHQSTLPRQTVVVPTYNLSKEVAVQGIIQNVVRKPAGGLMFGGHLIVATAQGNVDVQIGKFIFHDRDAISFTAGEQVRAIGVMTTFNGRAVFLARLVQTPGSTIAVRNVHGVEISPAARKSLVGQASTAGGVQ